MSLVNHENAIVLAVGCHSVSDSPRLHWPPCTTLAVLKYITLNLGLLAWGYGF
jgi:hypothetical protein